MSPFLFKTCQKIITKMCPILKGTRAAHLHRLQSTTDWNYRLYEVTGRFAWKNTATRCLEKWFFTYCYNQATTEPAVHKHGNPWRLNYPYLYFSVSCHICHTTPKVPVLPCSHSHLLPFWSFCRLSCCVSGCCNLGCWSIFLNAKRNQRLVREYMHEDHWWRPQLHDRYGIRIGAISI